MEHLTEDRNLETPKGITKELDSLTWSFLDSAANQESFEKYNMLLQKLSSLSWLQDSHIFQTDDVKVQVNKNGSIINLNSVGLEFWEYLDFGPVGGQKEFSVTSYRRDFEFESSAYLHVSSPDRLINNYKSCNFGSISKLNLSTVDTRPDLEPVTNGVMLMVRICHSIMLATAR